MGLARGSHQKGRFQSPRSNLLLSAFLPFASSFSREPQIRRLHTPHFAIANQITFVSIPKSKTFFGFLNDSPPSPSRLLVRSRLRRNRRKDARVGLFLRPQLKVSLHHPDPNRFAPFDHHPNYRTQTLWTVVPHHPTSTSPSARLPHAPARFSGLLPIASCVRTSNKTHKNATVTHCRGEA
ncbi:hypothetical protein QR680_018341 [Steinernema hermaphroditum]|uniref:Uncharacterized protein n=1 Tax=Steinernema hermaphroditum TaxID=289476 RepID=A0AA39HIG7_9BILA|nr:hypothetical protein QR680_018341 [Steinernema hermaphroditum]